MPEGDTVHRAADRLHRVLAGKVLTRFELRVPQAAGADLRGETVQEVLAVGKHLLHRIGVYTLHSHLRMEGSWDVHRPRERWRRPAFKARAVLSTDMVETVGFDLAEIRLVRTRDEPMLIGHLGPDPLSEEWDAGGFEDAVRRLAADARPLHVALLDQRIVAGFGNEYANEICFLRGVDPRRSAAETEPEATLRLGASLIRANRDRPARTTTGDSRKGHRLYVCFRDGRACRRCGTRILTARLGADPLRERDIYWCPYCQR